MHCETSYFVWNKISANFEVTYLLEGNSALLAMYCITSDLPHCKRAPLMPETRKMEADTLEGE